MSTLRENVEKAAKAKQQIVEGSLVIWNTRLETLVDTGDVKAALDQLRSPIEDVADVANNCGCNVQCGAAAEFAPPSVARAGT
jgi:hypothetical protein